MSRTLRRMTGIAGVAMALCLAIGLCSDAFAGVPVGVDPNDYSHCIINSTRWGHDVDNTGITLDLAVYYANHPEFGMCGRLIEVNASNIQVGGQITVTKSDLTIRAFKDVAKTLDLTKFAPTDQKCVFYLAGSNIVLKNLNLTGVSGADYNGVCFIGSNNTLQGVTVMGGKNGIFFDQNATGNRVLPDSKVQSSSEYGVVDHSGENGVNAVIMVNKISAISDTDNQSEKVDDDGLVDWIPDEFLSIDQMMGDFADIKDGAGTALLELSVSGRSGILKSTKPVVPLITSIEDMSGGAGTRYEIKGIFKSASGLVDETDAEGKAGFKPVNCSGATEKSVDRLAIFMVKDVEYKLVGVVGKSPAFGINAETGTFDFIVDKSKNPELQTGGRFVLVPISLGWQLEGRASNYKSFTGGNDCEAGTAPDIEGGGGNNSGGDGSMIGFNDESACNKKYKFAMTPADAKKDSDLDGIPDFLEMRVVKDSNGKWVFDRDRSSCSCTGTLSCWYRTDSDDDGIPDGKDNYGLKWADYINIPGGTPPIDVTALVIKGSTDDPAHYLAGGSSDLDPDVRDTDSDNDGIEDGAEDRSRLFRRTTDQNAVDPDKPRIRAYYYRFNTNGDGYTPYPAAPGSKDKVDCTDRLDTEELKNRGIRWGIYRAGGNTQTYMNPPLPYNMFDPSQPAEDTYLWILACVNETVTGNNAFNGEFEKGMGETDARSPDTDNDCVCDGADVGCAQVDYMTTVLPGFVGQTCQAGPHNTKNTRENPLWMNDHCPIDAYLTNECTPKCIDYETLNYVKFKEPKWLKHNDKDEVVDPPALKDEDDNGVKDLFEQTKTETDVDTGITWTRPDYEEILDTCSDMDNDGIPDCVERFDGECGNSTAQTSVLNPYDPDSDGDKLLDGMAKGQAKEDVCPFSAPSTGQSDEFTASGTPNYSCDPRMVYTQGSVPRILACFLDRDGDGVRDCIEDKDMNGQTNAPVTGMQGIFDSESDILKVDTDEDGLSDTAEARDGWPFRTNPNKADTDDDGINDKSEDRDGDGKITLAADMTGQGCGIAVMKRDIDPRKADTDGDGLSDKMELANVIIDDQQAFVALISDPTIWSEGGIPTGSNPNAKDSDGDKLNDNEEYDGTAIGYYDSNPCLPDSDGDVKKDNEELKGCRLNPDFNCVGSEDGNTGAGIDSDGDDLTNDVETKLGTDPFNYDSDGDGVKDGDEDTNHNGVYEPNLGETDPRAATGFDTDADGLSDGMELRYPTDPTNIDTDGDCIPDGPMMITDRTTGQQAQSKGEDQNRNGQYDNGSETNANSADTDGDGLADGFVASSGTGEDMNCNGIREIDAQDGHYLETDPRNPDSDMDGNSDYDEMTQGGYFNVSNMDRATSGREGCSIAGSSAGSAPSSMFYLMLGLIAAVKGIAGRVRKTPA